MSSKQQTRKKRLTPVKVISVFLIAFALVALHELDRLANWFGENCYSWTGGNESWCSLPQQGLSSSAARTLSHKLLEAENSLLAFTKELPLIGEAAPEPVSKVETPQPDPRSVAAQIQAAATSMAVTAQTQPASQAEPSGKSEATPPPSKPWGLLQPDKVLIVGDSMVLEGFGIALQRRLTSFDGLSVVREGKYSTGLTRPDYFDWLGHLPEVLDQYQPDLLVVNMGANDPQDIVADGKRYHVGDEGWNAIYGERVNRFLSIAAERGVTTFWVGLPIMGKGKYSRKIEVINKLVADACARQRKARYFDTWTVLATEDGAYSSFLKNPQGQRVRVRAKDEIHLTEAGGEIMTSYFLAASKPYVNWSEL